MFLVKVILQKMKHYVNMLCASMKFWIVTKWSCSLVICENCGSSWLQNFEFIEFTTSWPLRTKENKTFKFYGMACSRIGMPLWFPMVWTNPFHSSTDSDWIPWIPARIDRNLTGIDREYVYLLPNKVMALNLLLIYAYQDPYTPPYVM